MFDGPINSEGFCAYFEQQLVPVLNPGDIVVLDSLGSQKSTAQRHLIRGAGKALIPPVLVTRPHPIEQAFTKIKHWMTGQPAGVDQHD
jgi:transposase